MTLEKQVALIDAARILRALSAKGDMRIYLNTLADRVVLAAVDQDNVERSVVVQDVLNLRIELVEAGGLSNTVLSGALSGVNNLLTMRV